MKFIWLYGCIKYEILKLSVIGITMPVIDTILELRQYMSRIDKLELSIVGITTPVIDTILELRRCGFSVDHIISLALRHLREIT